jgi:hypothetical protein
MDEPTSELLDEARRTVELLVEKLKSAKDRNRSLERSLADAQEELVLLRHGGGSKLLAPARPSETQPAADADRRAKALQKNLDQKCRELDKCKTALAVAVAEKGEADERERSLQLQIERFKRNEVTLAKQAERAKSEAQRAVHD